jgi:hypothetical protein
VEDAEDGLKYLDKSVDSGINFDCALAESTIVRYKFTNKQILLSILWY